MIVMKNVPTAVPKTMATAIPDVVSLSSFFMQMSPPAESVVQYMPVAQELAVAVVGVQVSEPLVTQQADVEDVE